MARNQSSGLRLHERLMIWLIRASTIAVLLVVICVPCSYFVADRMLSGIGPGAADYNYELPGGLLLFRSASNMRVVCWSDEADPKRNEAMRQYRLADGWILIDADVSYIGWSDRYIVCYQTYSPQADERRTGWWIVDTQQRQRIGPMDEAELRSRLESLGIAGIAIKPPEEWR